MEAGYAKAEGVVDEKPAAATDFESMDSNDSADGNRRGFPPVRLGCSCKHPGRHLYAMQCRGEIFRPATDCTFPPKASAEEAAGDAMEQLRCFDSIDSGWGIQNLRKPGWADSLS